MEVGSHTRSEILSQPEAWDEALAVTAKAKLALIKLLTADYEQVVFTGCGSTYYLSLASAALFQELTGHVALAVPGGELFLNPKVSVGRGSTLLVAISRSGSTSETVRAVEQFKGQNKGPVVVITNYGDQPLAGLADIPIIIEKGQEQSIAQTRSFASMYVAATALAAVASKDESLLDSMRKLPEVGRRLLSNYDSFAREVGENLSLDRFYFLGSGIRYGLACEVNLKMKEMTLTHSEPFHFLEFRHGPMSMVTENTAVVGLLSGKNRGHESTVLNDMAARGASVISLAESDASVSFESGIPESVQGVLHLPVLQLMAFYRSLAKGLNPDRPKNLEAVVKLEL